jgi:hypothetical protein
LKKVFSILFLLIFLLAQYGKVISYVYCKWEVRSEVHCDCEKILVQEQHQGSDQLASNTYNNKLEEPVVIQSNAQLFVGLIIIESYGNHSTSSPIKGFPGLPFHPPALV